MKKRSISFLLSLLMVLSLLPTVVLAEEGSAAGKVCRVEVTAPVGEPTPTEETASAGISNGVAQTYVPIEIGEIQNPKLMTSGTPAAIPNIAQRYYRKQLAGMSNGTALVAAYDAFYSCVEKSETEASLSQSITAKQVSIVIDAYLKDSPEHFWVAKTQKMRGVNENTITSIIPQYLYSGSDLTAAKSKFASAIAGYENALRGCATDESYALGAHDALAKDISYRETGDDAHSAYGALVEHVAVCEGYAKAYQLLLNRRGMECFLVSGSSMNPSTGASELHGWNMVKLGADWVHTDLTWDDQGSRIFHAYYACTTVQIQADHIIDSTFPIPNSTSKAHRYFTPGVNSFSTLSKTAIASLLQQGYSNADRSSTFSFEYNGETNVGNWMSSNLRDILTAANATGNARLTYAPLGNEYYCTISGITIPESETREACGKPVVTLSNVASTGNIKVSWDAVKGAAKYEVYRATSKTGTYSRISTTTKTSVTNTNNVTPGKTYYYKVRALDDKGNAGEYSEIKSRTCDYAQPTVSAALNADGNPKLTWKAVDGASKYEVYRATSKSGEYSKITTTSKTSVANTKNLTAGTTYYYKVRAIGSVSGATSAYSTVVNCTAPLESPVLTLSNVASTGKIKLTWTAVEGAARYEVYRATSETGDYTLLTTTTATSVTNKNTTPGKTYYYEICARNADGSAGAYSAAESRTCDYAQPVITLSNVASSGKIKVSWEAVEGATKYEVYRATSKSGTYSRISTTTKTSVTNTNNVAPGKTYYYKVRAIGSASAATSAYSDVKSRTCDYARPTVSVALSSGKPKLTWDKVDGASKYEVYRATSKTGTYDLLKTTTGTSLANTSAKKGTTYYYKVRAIGSVSGATSAYSTVVSIKATK